MAKKRKTLYESYKSRYINDDYAHEEMLSETAFNEIVKLNKMSLTGKDLEQFKKNPARAIVMAQRQVSSAQASLLAKTVKDNLKDSNVANTPYLKREIERRGDFFAAQLVSLLETSLGISYSEIIDSP